MPLDCCFAINKSRMVYNKRDLAKASPKVKRLGTNVAAAKKTTVVVRSHLPSTSGSTTNLRSEEDQRSIKVIVRVRPHNERELQDNYRTVIKVIDGKMLIFDPKEEEDPFFFKGVAQKGIFSIFCFVLKFVYLFEKKRIIKLPNAVL